jgi:8-oxo-dGTP diphosphatase
MQQPQIGVGILITHKDQVLLIQRKAVHGAGSWSTPGGHLDYGESPEQCAARELLEEVNITCEDMQFIAITNDIFESPGKHYITIWMQAEYRSGEPKISAEYEVAQLGWFRWDKLPEPLFLPLKNLLEGKSYPPHGFQRSTD